MKQCTLLVLILSALLDRRYPEERAGGFEVGQLRGAFTLGRTLEP